MLTLLFLGEDLVGAVCQDCDRQTALDPSLPFVNQAASFLTGHGCPSRAEAPWDEVLRGLAGR